MPSRSTDVVAATGSNGPPSPQVAVVTGANQGLGYALVERLAEDLPAGSTIYLTGRRADAVAEAVSSLAHKRIPPTGAVLDVTSDASVAHVVAEIERRHGGIDILISNAAARISPTLTQADQVDLFVDTNNHGTFRILGAFHPLLNDGARVVVVASAFGSLRNLRPELHRQFDVENASFASIGEALKRYSSAVNAGTEQAHGWPGWMNVVSKVAQVAAVKVYAREHAAAFAARNIVVNAACPGLIDTEASRPWFDDMSSAETPAVAACDVAWLATTPSGVAVPYGELIQHRKPLAWT